MGLLRCRRSGFSDHGSRRMDTLYERATDDRKGGCELNWVDPKTTIECVPLAKRSQGKKKVE